MRRNPAEGERLICPPRPAVLDRRAALAGAAGSCAGFCALPAAAQIAPEAARTRPQPRDQPVRIDDDGRRPLAIGDIPTGENPVMAWPLDPNGEMLRSGSGSTRCCCCASTPRASTRRRANSRQTGSRLFGNFPAHRLRGQHLAIRAADSRMPVPFLALRSEGRRKVLSGPSPRRLAAFAPESGGWRSARGGPALCRPGRISAAALTKTPREDAMAKSSYAQAIVSAGALALMLSAGAAIAQKPLPPQPTPDTRRRCGRSCRSTKRSPPNG